MQFWLENFIKVSLTKTPNYWRTIIKLPPSIIATDIACFMFNAFHFIAQRAYKYWLGSLQEMKPKQKRKKLLKMHVKLANMLNFNRHRFEINFHYQDKATHLDLRNWSLSFDELLEKCWKQNSIRFQ